MQYFISSAVVASRVLGEFKAVRTRSRPHLMYAHMQHRLSKSKSTLSRVIFTDSWCMHSPTHQFADADNIRVSVYDATERLLHNSSAFVCSNTELLNF